jgi:hypothetical protein
LSDGVYYGLEKRAKKEHDFTLNAFRVVQEAIGEAEPPAEKPKRTIANPKAMGQKGGKALTSEQRKEITQKAAMARWNRV